MGVLKYSKKPDNYRIEYIMLYFSCKPYKKILKSNFPINSSFFICEKS